MSIGGWIDDLEADLGLAARLRLVANAGGQRRDIPGLGHAAHSKLAEEVGAPVAEWLAARFATTPLDIPSAHAQRARDAASQLRAAILDAGLTDARRSANHIAREFGVTSMWVRKLRAEMRAEYGIDRQLRLPLDDDAQPSQVSGVRQGTRPPDGL